LTWSVPALPGRAAPERSEVDPTNFFEVPESLLSWLGPSLPVRAAASQRPLFGSARGSGFIYRLRKLRRALRGPLLILAVTGRGFCSFRPSVAPSSPAEPSPRYDLDAAPNLLMQCGTTDVLFCSAVPCSRSRS